MTYEELRYIVTTFPKYPGTEIIAPAPVIHEGFPGNFNLSFAEYELIVKGSGQMLDPLQDYIFSKIQPCIRLNDFISMAEGNYSNRHLALFDMADVGGLIYLKDRSGEQENLARHSAHSLYNFIPEISRNTFLALNVYGSPTPWGYRNEAHIEYNGQLWDIGTIENCMFRPIFNASREIIDFTNFNHAVSASAVGLERILCLRIGISQVVEIPKIKNLIERVKNTLK